MVTQNDRAEAIAVGNWRRGKGAAMSADRLRKADIKKLISDVCNAAAFFTMEYQQAKNEGRNLSYGLDSKIEPIIRAALAESDAPAPCIEQNLTLGGKATDHIWLMEDIEGYIGIRLDCGDSGTVYVTPEQAKDLAEQLTTFCDGPRVITDGTMQSSSKNNADVPAHKGRVITDKSEQPPAAVAEGGRK